jgi:hypothetical protein
MYPLAVPCAGWKSVAVVPCCLVVKPCAGWKSVAVVPCSCLVVKQQHSRSTTSGNTATRRMPRNESREGSRVTEDTQQQCEGLRPCV